MRPVYRNTDNRTQRNKLRKDYAMRYNIRINEVKSDDSQIQGFATVTFGDSIVVRNIAIIKKHDSDDLFVSMPSYRTNDVTEKGEPIYRDVCNPITKEFYEELSKNILDAFNNRQTIGKNGLDIGEPSTEVAFTVKVTPLTREDSSLRGLGRIYLEDNFVISNVKMIEGKNGMFISMPDYRTEKYKDGKPIYREIAFPITKEFREKLYGEFEKAYQEEKTKAISEEPAKKPTSKAKAKDKEPEKEPAVAR